MADLPAIVYVQVGQLDGHDIFVNRTPDGAMNRALGTGFQPGVSVGVYKLDRTVKLQLKVVEVQNQVAVEPIPAVPPTPPLTT